DFLAASIGALQLLPEADAIYSGQYVYAENDLNELSAVRFGPMNPSLLEQRNYIDLNCFLHRRSVVDSGLKFNESLQRLVDWDFILQVKSNYNIVSVPVLLSCYYHHAAKYTITKTVYIEPAVEYIQRRKYSVPRVPANPPFTRQVCVV